MEILGGILFTAILAICFFLALIYREMLALHRIADEMRSSEPETPEPTGLGMDLEFFSPKRQARNKKRRRFTDKSRDWITAHESASRR